ncbi:hypothetical protein [Amphritea pacifica]|uniref:Uncharacterized protein n=1 Tax=Amphritea pacifica TaxID=2811233 RepID=A0ABS2WEE9_9GAMM|nr:hypothetical protein [Amphritea pacifica]MBN0989892.1 hypothetical protein [Amphritea pacifica]
MNAAERANNAIIAAAIGGTAALVGGGKFMNGAVTGAFSRLLNDDNVRKIRLNNEEIVEKNGCNLQVVLLMMELVLGLTLVKC